MTGKALELERETGQGTHTWVGGPLAVRPSLATTEEGELSLVRPRSIASLDGSPAGDHHGHHEAFPAFLLQASSSHPASAHYLPAASKAVKTMLNLVKVDNRLIGGILVEDDINPWS